VRTDFLLRCAGADPAFVQTAADRARYVSMGSIVLLTAIAATASLTLALSLVFPGREWFRFLPVGLLWGAIVLSFDRWIVSSIDYGPLTAAAAETGHPPRTSSKAVQFFVRFTMAILVGLVISEPIVLAVFGPEISQQLTAQHLSDIQKQTTQINSATSRQIAASEQSVTAAQRTLRSATRKANLAHTIYICELTAKCRLPQGTITGVAGLGPQTTQDFHAWRHALGLQNQAQQALKAARATEHQQAGSLQARAAKQIAAATARINADNGLLARERALDTLSRENPGFLLRRVLLWLSLMFIDLVPVLLKTFSPPTVHDELQRAAGVRVAHNAMSDAIAESNHGSQKRAITRQQDLEYHPLVVAALYGRRMEEDLGLRVNGMDPRIANGNGLAIPNGQHRSGSGGTHNGEAAPPGWVIGNRWLIQRRLTDMPHSGRVPFVATDLRREYPFDVVVKIIAPPPKAAGSQAVKERRHAQLEMALPLGHVHDNIAEVIDCDLDPEQGFYIVTRLYPTTLEQYLREAAEQDSLTMGRVLTIAVQILAGLRAAWDRGFVHLDLKPANVALTEEGTVKLIDFGLAQQYQRASDGNGTTTPRFTPFYAPPEQMERRDSSWINRNADIRALGAVIYRMLTGYPPLFREARALGLVDASGHIDSYADIGHLVSTVEPIPVADLVSNVPEELDTLVRRWLRIDPQMRCPGTPTTMAERAWLELTAVLERAQAGPESGFLAGPRAAREPGLTHLGTGSRYADTVEPEALGGAAQAKGTMPEAG
jgi:serine/threonine protein kinase